MIIIINITDEYYKKIEKENIFGKELMIDEGFIHASTEKQFPLIIPRLVNKGGGFMVLFIDTEKLKSEIKWEYSSSLNQDFPHIYGEINMDAVIKIEKLDEYIEK